MKHRCSVIVLMFSMICGILYQYAAYVALGACSRIDPDILSSLNGTLFVVLKDKRIIEYSLAGDLQAKNKTILCMHGSLQTGRAICNIVDSAFKKKGVRALCPTQPGLGYSSWTENPMSEYYHDIEELSDLLNISKYIGIAGWSAGGLPTAVISSSLPNRMGNNVLFVVATPPDPNWYDYSTFGKLYLWIAANTNLNEVLTHFLVLPMLRKNCVDFFKLPSIDKTTLKNVEQLNIIELCKDMVNSVSNSCERGYTSTGHRWFRSTEINWEMLKNKHVTIVYAENDNMITNKSALMYHKMIPESKIYCYKGMDHAMTGILIDAYISALWNEAPSLQTSC